MIENEQQAMVTQRWLERWKQALAELDDWVPQDSPLLACYQSGYASMVKQFEQELQEYRERIAAGGDDVLHTGEST
jgi:hypothetical protein